AGADPGVVPDLHEALPFERLQMSAQALEPDHVGLTVADEDEVTLRARALPRQSHPSGHRRLCEKEPELWAIDDQRRDLIVVEQVWSRLRQRFVDLIHRAFADNSPQTFREVGPLRADVPEGNEAIGGPAQRTEYLDGGQIAPPPQRCKHARGRAELGLDLLE